MATTLDDLPEGFALVDEPVEGLPDGFTLVDDDRPRITVQGVQDALTSGITGAAADLIGGLSATAMQVNPLIQAGTRLAGTTPSELGSQVIGGVREAIAVPPTAAGQETTQGIVQALPDVVQSALEGYGEFSKRAEDAAESVSGMSPAFAAAVEVAPQSALEFAGAATGLGAAKSMLRSAGGRGGRKILSKAAPSAAELKRMGRAQYTWLKERGVTISGARINDLSERLTELLRSEGVLDSPSTFRATRDALRTLQRVAVESPDLAGIERARKVARGAERNLIQNAADARTGAMVVDEIDDFLESLKPGELQGATGGEIVQRYQVARDLWGRAKRSELIERAITNAELEPNFELALTRTLKSYIKEGGRYRKFFNDAEVRELRRVVNGGPRVNLFRMLERLGYGSNRIVGPALGTVTGFTLGGTEGALFVAGIGWVGRRTAARLTEKGARFADAVIRAGRDGDKVAAAYLRAGGRKPRELGELLTDPKRRLDLMTRTDPLTRQAIQYARRNRAILFGAFAPAAAQNLSGQESQIPQ